FEATMSRLSCNEEYLVAVDQTSLAITDRRRSKGMGRIGSDPKETVSGFQVMSALVIGAEGAVKGLCAQQWWERDENCPAWNEDIRAFEKRESVLWHQALEEAEESRQSAKIEGRAWYQLDRGADSWHLWERVLDDDLRVT